MLIKFIHHFCKNTKKKKERLKCIKRGFGCAFIILVVLSALKKRLKQKKKRKKINLICIWNSKGEEEEVQEKVLNVLLQLLFVGNGVNFQLFSFSAFFACFWVSQS